MRGLRELLTIATLPLPAPLKTADQWQKVSIIILGKIDHGSSFTEDAKMSCHKAENFTEGNDEKRKLDWTFSVAVFSNS